jgi:ribosomal subunit interface protein
MQTPVQIVFHKVAHSEALENLVREKTRKLEVIFPRLMRCHVSIDQPHRHKQQGEPFNVRITLHVPGGELAVSRDRHEDVYAALNDAFDAARRQLEEHAQRMRREVKHHGNGRASSGSETEEQQ